MLVTVDKIETYPSKKTFMGDPACCLVKSFTLSESTYNKRTIKLGAFVSAENDISN